MKKKIFTKARYLLALVSLVLLGTNAVKAEEKTSTFSLVTFTAGNPVTITSSDNTEVTLKIGRSGSSNVSAASDSRGLRVQEGRYFEITVPEGTYVTQVVFTSRTSSKTGGNGNTGDGSSLVSGATATVGVWSITGENDYWNLGGVAATYTWKNGGKNFSSPMTFTQAASAGDAYINTVTVSYDNQPELENEEPTISVPTSYDGDTKHDIQLKATVDGVPAPTIQWYSCDDVSGNNPQEIEEATEAIYTFSPSVAGTYYFYAKATNAAGEAQSEVTTVTVIDCYTATFSKGENSSIQGIAPAMLYSNGEYKVTIPTNYSLSLEGNTLASWKDESDGVYELGKEYQLSGDILLTPTFTTNKKSLTDVETETTVNFIKAASTAAYYENVEAAVVEQVKVGEDNIDVALLIDATSSGAKFDLQPASPRAQTNNNTKISIPVTDGAVVSIKIQNSNKNFSCTINGEDVANYLDGSDSDTQRIMTYTYNGNENYIDYIVKTTNTYAYSIDVTYPVQPKKSVTTTITEAQYATFYADFAVAIPEDVTAYGTALNEEKTAITLTAIEGNVIPAKTAVILYSETAQEYTFTETEEAADTEVAFALTGTTEETDVPEGAYVLGNKDGKVGFYHLAEGKKLGANQAYLTVPEGARVAFIGFGGNTVTAIDAVAAPATAGKAYNLNGVQAAPNAKGVVIMDGKKVVIK